LGHIRVDSIWPNLFIFELYRIWLGSDRVRLIIDTPNLDTTKNREYLFILRIGIAIVIQTQIYCIIMVKIVIILLFQMRNEIAVILKFLSFKKLLFLIYYPNNILTIWNKTTFFPSYANLKITIFHYSHLLFSISLFLYYSLYDPNVSLSWGIWTVEVVKEINFARWLHIDWLYLHNFVLISTWLPARQFH
jgi:hypothetical protein